jgi:hypothetical protein
VPRLIAPLARALMLCAIGATALSGQIPAGGPRLDVRADVLAGDDDRSATVHAGVAVARQTGMLQLLAGAGAGPWRGEVSAHAEAGGRFHIDPYRQRRWGLYGAAGAGVLWADGSEPYLLFLLGIEGPRPAHGWSPAFEAGLSRGFRAALVLRRAPVARR